MDDAAENDDTTFAHKFLNDDGGEQQQWQQYLRQRWTSVDSDGIRDDNGGSGRQGMQPQKLDKQWDRPSMTKRG